MNATERAAVSWMFSGDTGSSSETLCRYLLLGTVSRNYIATPSDAEDFGRCHRLLQRVPAYRKRIGEMAKVDGWEGLATSWDELEAMYLAATAIVEPRSENEQLKRRRLFQKLYDRLKELQS